MSERNTAVWRVDESEPLVSVVIPVYNVEKYLDRCVQSVVDQQLCEIEIILVDDGSTDGSGALCDAWSRRDSRIRVIHKPNGGLSDARNAGVAAAKAKYIGFVDSDDYIAPTMYRLLYDNLVDSGADLSLCGAYDCFANRMEVSQDGIKELIDSRTAIAMTLESRRLWVSSVLRLYPRWILGDRPFPVGRAYEDAFTAVEFLSRAKKVIIDPSPQYYYWHREGSITTRSHNEKTRDIIDAYEYNRLIIEKDFPELRELALFRCYWAHFIVLDKMLLSDTPVNAEEKERVVAYLREHASDILANRYVSSGRKLALRALRWSVLAYGVFARLQAWRRQCSLN